MKQTSNFKDESSLINFLHEMIDGRVDEDWGWQEGFCCGLNEAGIIDDEELDDIISKMKK